MTNSIFIWTTASDAEVLFIIGIKFIYFHRSAGECLVAIVTNLKYPFIKKKKK